MYSLYLDTSYKYLCIGVSKDYQIIYKLQKEAEKKQSELTIPYLKQILDELNLSLNDIDEVVVTIGPGSFTGIRIGMCIVKVLASINNIDLKVITSLNAYASSAKDIVLLDAKAHRAYIGIFDNNKVKYQESVHDLSDIEELIKEHLDYDVVMDAYLVNKESKTIDVIENMNRVAPTLSKIENVDSLVPLYLKER